MAVLPVHAPTTLDCLVSTVLLHLARLPFLRVRSLLGCWKTELLLGNLSFIYMLLLLHTHVESIIFPGSILYIYSPRYLRARLLLTDLSFPGP